MSLTAAWRKWLSLSIGRKGLVVVAPPVLGLCLATAAFFEAARENRQGRKAVARSVAVTAQLRLLLGLVIDVESSARGFLLTGEDRFFAPYHAARKALPEVQDELETQLGSTARLQVAETLRSLVDRRLRISEEIGRQPITRRLEGDTLAALVDQGKASTDAIREQVDALEVAERASLTRAQMQAERAESFSRWAILAGVALGLVGGFGGNVLFTRGVARRVIRLLQKADDLAEGRPVAASASGSDEVEQLDLALCRASDLLRRREQALDGTQRFLTQLLDSAPTAVLRVQLPSLDCVYVSPNVTRLFGIAAAAEPGLLRRRLHPEHLPDVEDAAGHLTEGEQPLRLQVLFQSAASAHRWVTLTMVNTVGELDSRIPAALVYLHDDDERHRAQQELAERQTTLQAILDASPDIITITAADGKILLVNPAVDRVLGWRPADVGEHTLFDWMHPDDRPVARTHFGVLIRGEESDGVFGFRAEDIHGHLVNLEAHASVLRDGTGDPVGVVAVIRDVSERARTEEMQRAAREAAERANLSKSEFVSRMSHELRTPLNAVIGFAQLLELEDLAPEQQESVNHILKGGRHLLDLIDEILDIARIETGRLKLSTEPVSLISALSDVVDMVRPLAVRGEVELIETTSDPGLHVLADRQRLTQILLNLLSNAVKYNRPRGTVQVTCQRSEGGRVRIEVSDTGLGIRQEDLPLLFTPFERLGAEQTGIEGTGIGLALSRQLAEAMGGSLEVSTVFGRGSAFSLLLPEAEGQVERYERFNGDLVRSTTPSRTGTVLHIEDNLANLKLIERILDRHSSLRVVATMQGRMGIQLAKEHQPDLVLLDLHLPDMGGDEVLRQLRDDAATSGIPVVIASADATRGEIQRLLNSGAAGYLTKPIDVRELLRVIEYVLGHVGND